MTETNSTIVYQYLWNAADILRSKMDASEYKDYLLGIIFYKYLSKQMLYRVTDLLEEETLDLQETQKNYKDEDLREDLLEELQHDFAYIVNVQKVRVEVLKMAL